VSIFWLIRHQARARFSQIFNHPLLPVLFTNPGRNLSVPPLSVN